MAATNDGALQLMAAAFASSHEDALKFYGATSAA